MEGRRKGGGRESEEKEINGRNEDRVGGQKDGGSRNSVKRR